MKRNAIVRIVIYGLVIVILAAILLGGITHRGMLFSHLFSVDSPAQGTVSSYGKVDPDTIKNIHIEWISGSITVQPGDVDAIVFEEKGSFDDSEKMVFHVSDRTLNIHYCKIVSNFFGGFTIKAPAKDLVITVPRQWAMDDLDVESVSAELLLEQLLCRSIDVQNVSGKCDISHCQTQEASIETVSGQVDLTGEVDVLEMSGVNADCTVFPASLPSHIELDTVSGDMTVYLPHGEDIGFTATMDSLSGHITSDFPATVSGGKYIYGTGRCQITCDSVSGDLFIREPELRTT